MSQDKKEDIIEKCVESILSTEKSFDELQDPDTWREMLSKELSKAYQADEDHERKRLLDILNSSKTGEVYPMNKHNEEYVEIVEPAVSQFVDDLKSAVKNEPHEKAIRTERQRILDELEDKEIIQEFINGTDKWLEVLPQKEVCNLCGIDPKKIKELQQALDDVKELLDKGLHE